MRITKHFNIAFALSTQQNPKVTIVMLHGFGADFQDLAALSEEITTLPKNTQWLFPNGVLQIALGPGMMGRAWFPLDARELEQAMLSGKPKDYSKTLPSGLHPVSDRMAEFLRSLVKPDHRLIVGGFSQGAMVACDAVLTHKVPVHSLLLLSGALVAEQRWTEALRAWPERTELRVFQSHGEQDPLLDFHCAEQLRDLLEREGVFVDFHGFRGQHEIPRAVLQKLGQFLKGT